MRIARLMEIKWSDWAAGELRKKGVPRTKKNINWEWLKMRRPRETEPTDRLRTSFQQSLVRGDNDRQTEDKRSRKMWGG